VNCSAISVPRISELESVWRLFYWICILSNKMPSIFGKHVAAFHHIKILPVRFFQYCPDPIGIVNTQHVLWCIRPLGEQSVSSFTVHLPLNILTQNREAGRYGSAAGFPTQQGVIYRRVGLQMAISQVSGSSCNTLPTLRCTRHFLSCFLRPIVRRVASTASFDTSFSARTFPPMPCQGSTR
jgi:hypothetical protein